MLSRDAGLGLVGFYFLPFLDDDGKKEGGEAEGEVPKEEAVAAGILSTKLYVSPAHSSHSK